MAQHLDKPLMMSTNPMPGASGATKDYERRQAIRYPYVADAEVVEIRSKTRVIGRSSDLGLGGCYIDTLSPLAVGNVVNVRITRDAHTFEAVASVAYAHVSMGMGLAFTKIKQEHQTVLNAWISELSGGQPHEFESAATESAPEDVPPLLNLRQVVNELINMLVRRKTITEQEGAALLHQMFR